MNAQMVGIVRPVGAGGSCWIKPGLYQPGKGQPSHLVAIGYASKGEGALLGYRRTFDETSTGSGTDESWRDI